MSKNKSKERPFSKKNQKTPPQNICFSFAYIPKKCVEIKEENFFFTNKIPEKEIKDYRTTIENAFWNWSTKTIQRLEQDQDCYPVRKDKINKTRNVIARIFQKADYPQQGIEQNIQDPDIYKFKITKQIRMFGTVERNVVYILLYDIGHLINKDNNFKVPPNLVCTGCLKSCEKNKKQKHLVLK